jgi:hypothetical protein
MRSVLALALLSLMLVDGCRCGKPEAGTDAGPVDNRPKVPLPDLVKRRVPDTDIVLSLPKGWLIEMPDPGPRPPPPPGDVAKIELKTRTLLVARPGTLTPGTLVAPKLEVLEDLWLPLGTTGVDYLVAQRASNAVAIGANIRHVEAEPSRREGRPTYHIRDEWNVLAPGVPAEQSREVSQEALLLLDTATTPDNKPAMHGYTVVITMEKLEFEAMQPVVREILASVRFEARDR